MRRHLLALLMFGLIFSQAPALAQEGKEAVVGKPSSSEAVPSIQQKPLPDDVAAMVNGKAIPREILMQGLLRRFGLALLVDLTTMELVEQAAEKRHIKLSEKELDEFIKSQAAKVGGEEIFARGLAQQGIPMEDHRRMTRTRLLVRKIVEKEAPPEVTEDELKRAFRSTYGAKSVAQVIFVRKKEKAQEVFEKAKAGADFSLLAQKECEDRNLATAGGLLPPFPRGFLTEVFGSRDLEEALSYLKPGEVSEPVQTENGFFIIKLLERQPAQDVKFSDVRDALKRNIAEMKLQRNISDFLENLRRNAEIEINQNLIKLQASQ